MDTLYKCVPINVIIDVVTSIYIYDDIDRCKKITPSTLHQFQEVG